jgi:DNA primase
MNWHLLNSRLPTLAVLRRLRLECRRIEGDSWRGRCPFHQSSGRASRSLAVSCSRRKFYCHNCKVHGDLIDLWAHVRCITPAEAAVELEGEFGC